MKDTVLIVGASGFIGSYIYGKLSQDKNLKIIGTYCNSFHKDLIKIDYLNDSFTKDIIKLKKLTTTNNNWRNDKVNTFGSTLLSLLLKSLIETKQSKNENIRPKSNE